MFKKIALVVVMFLLGGLIAACTSAEATPTAGTTTRPPTGASSPAPAAATPTAAPVKGGTVRIGVRCDTPGIDPHAASTTCEYPNWLVYNKLVGFDKDLKAIPELAESWDIAQDGKTVTFKLKKGVKFQDGTDFNAKAVKFNMDRLGQPTARFRTILADVASVEVVDDYTVKFNMKKPSSPLLMDLAGIGGGIVSPAAVEKWGKDYPQHPVGTGPYKLGDWIKDSKYELDRNESYWEQGKPYLDKLIFNILPDGTVRGVNLRSGSLDFADEISPKDVNTMKSAPNVKVYQALSMGINRITFHTEKAPFDNMALRQAISFAIDRDSIAKNIFYGLTQGGSGPISPVSWAYDPAFPSIKRDVAKAKAKLAEAGKPEGLEFILSVFNTEDYQPEAEAIQAQLAEVGIKAKINSVTTAVGINDLQKGNFVAFINQQTAYLDPDSYLYMEYYSTSGGNRTRYKNPKFDAIMDQARATYDDQGRKKLYSDATKIIIDEVPQAIVFYPPVVAAATNKIQNFVLYPGWSFKFIAFKDAWMSK